MQSAISFTSGSVAVLSSYSFDLLTFVVLMSSTFVVCVTNYMHLRTQMIPRAQMRARRSWQIWLLRRTGVEWTTLPFVRILKDCLTKLTAVGGSYLLISGSRIGLVACGIAASIALLGWHLCRLVNQLVHPKSVYHRMSLMYRWNAGFMRQRLLFEFLRRVLWIGFFVACASYGLSALGTDQVRAPGGAGPRPFLLHFQSALTSITSVGTQGLEYRDWVGQLFQLSCTLIAVVLVFGILGLVVNILARDPTDVRFLPLTKDALAKLPQHRRIDPSGVAITVKRVVAQVTAGEPAGISSSDDLISDLGADSMEMVEIIMAIEDYYSITVSDAAAQDARTVGELVAAVLGVLTGALPKAA